jgi:hypothetical protein
MSAAACRGGILVSPSLTPATFPRVPLALPPSATGSDGPRSCRTQGRIHWLLECLDSGKRQGYFAYFFCIAFRSTCARGPCLVQVEMVHCWRKADTLPRPRLLLTYSKFEIVCQPCLDASYTCHRITGVLTYQRHGPSLHTTHQPP